MWVKILFLSILYISTEQYSALECEIHKKKLRISIFNNKYVIEKESVVANFVFLTNTGIIIIIIIIIMSLFKEDDIFSNNTNLTYGPHYKTNKTNKIYTLCTVQNLKSCTLY